jgi:serine/threonine protein kinase
MESGGAHPATRLAGTTIGPFTVGDLLGEGAMGVVYRAVAANGDVVALKLLRHELTEDATLLRRFEHESELVAGVRNRHVVELIGSGADAGQRWIAFRYAEGGSLADRIEGPPLDIDEILTVSVGVASGVDALHDAGVIHRDIKPGNIMLDGAGRALITDFGLAKRHDLTALTQIGDVFGTTLYMAPEMIRGDAATAASDIYALGCVLFECIAGLPPFSGNPLSIAMSHLSAEPRDPTLDRPDLPEGIGYPVLRALAKDPAERPTTAIALARMIAAAAGRP